jgi:hypothetical protein
MMCRINDSPKDKEVERMLKGGVMVAGDRVKVIAKCLPWSGAVDESGVVESIWKSGKLASVVFDEGGRIDGVSIGNLRVVVNDVLLNKVFINRMLVVK